MFITETEAIFLTIEEYIKSKEKFSLMPFVTIYTAIMELINDGYIEQTAFEKAGGRTCGGGQNPASEDVRDFHRQGTRFVNKKEGSTR